MMWWLRRRDADAARKAEQEAKLKAAQRMTSFYEQLAPALAALPPDELAERIRRAFSRRPA